MSPWIRGARGKARAGPLDDSAALPASSPRAARGDERALRRASVLRVVVPAVAADYAAQVPYYLHQYDATRHAPPSLPGTAMLAATLLWFALGIVGLRCGSARGYWLLVSFLAVESLFYLQTQAVQVVSGHGVLLYVLHPSDPVLFVVFGIGYVNLVAAGWAVCYLLRHRAAFLARSATSE